ncbi:MAG: hypothetical protein V1809_03680 [Planctomycetota bacterium]
MNVMIRIAHSGFLAAFALAAAFAAVPCALGADDPFETLQEAVANRYDLDEAGLKRAAAYVESPELVKTLDAAARNHIVRTKFEAVIEPPFDFSVETRAIPNDFGPFARAGMEGYRGQLEILLRDISKATTLLPNLLRTNVLKTRYAGTVKTEKDRTVIRLEKKKSDDRPSRRGRKTQRPADDYDTITVTLGKDRLLETVELGNTSGRTVIRTECQKIDKMWDFRQVDVAKYDDRERFDERMVLVVNRVNAGGIALPASFVVTRLDEKGSPLIRRNEPNPVTLRLKDHQVEVKKDAKK